MVIEQSTLITVTDKAAEKAKVILAEKGIENAALRVFVVGGGCSGYQYGMAIARNREDDDIAIDVGGLTILVDSESAPLIDGAEVGPTVRDRDGDGLIDGVEEYVYHSFAGAQDTDNDGLEDGDEVTLHRTDPISADTDCDGVTDAQEISAGTDPLHGPGGSTCTL